MKNDYMLFECLECGETYLADNRCDGYKCPECDGHIVPRGFIKGIEEDIKDMQDKVNKAKHNGLIRKYKRKDDNTRIEDINITINFNAEEFSKDLAEELLKAIEKQRKSSGDYIKCYYK